MLRTRLALTAVAAVAAGAVATPIALAHDGTRVQNLVLGVGADETSANFNWSAPGLQQEYLQIAPATTFDGTEFPVDAATTIPAERGGLTIREARYPRTAEISGLEENTAYVYRAGSERSGWSAPYTFTTGTFGNEWEFSFFGDPQIGASQMAMSSARVDDGGSWERTAAAIGERHPDSSLWLSAGDQVDFFLDGQIQQHEYSLFFTPDELRENRFAANRGNHDVSKAYSEAFNLPNSTATGIQPHNYFFEHNNVLFVALDSNTITSGELEAQKDFLRSTVENHGADKDWIVVTYHHSTYSQAYHQTDRIVQDYRHNGMVDLISELGVDVVLAGHDHIHTRSHLMVGNTPQVPEGETGPGDVLTPADNEVLYLTGTSSTGSKYYDFAVAEGRSYEEYPEITTMEQSDAAGLTAEHTAYWIQDRTPDYTQIQVSPETMVLTTYNVADGSVVDQVTLDTSAQ